MGARNRRRPERAGRKQKRYEQEQVATHLWPSLRWHALPADAAAAADNSSVSGDACAGDDGGAATALRPLHARSLLVLLQSEIHARRFAHAHSVLAVLLRQTAHLAAPLSQAGAELLCARTSVAPQCNRWMSRFTQLDHANATSITLEVMGELMRRDALDEGCQRLHTALGSCAARQPCGHDGDLHGVLIWPLPSCFTTSPPPLHHL